MPIRLIIGSYFKKYTDNEGVVTVKGRTIKECLDDLIVRHPALKDHIFNKNGDLVGLVTLSGEIKSPEKVLSKNVSDGDTIHILPAAGGG